MARHTGISSSKRCGGEPVLVAVVGDGDALDQLHDEVGPAAVGGPGVEHLGDVGVVHQGQGLCSAAKRAMTWTVSMPGLMILSATRRRTGWSCSAR